MLWYYAPYVIIFCHFIDYTAAFDSVSHCFLDKALARAKASPKCRAIFRSIYAAATARTKVEDTNGKHVFSEVFPIYTRMYFNNYHSKTPCRLVNTHEHVFLCVISNANMCCFQYLCDIPHEFYVNTTIQQQQTYQGTII